MAIYEVSTKFQGENITMNVHRRIKRSTLMIFSIGMILVNAIALYFFIGHYPKSTAWFLASMFCSALTVSTQIVIAIRTNENSKFFQYVGVAPPKSTNKEDIDNWWANNFEHYKKRREKNRSRLRSSAGYRALHSDSEMDRRDFAQRLISNPPETEYYEGLQREWEGFLASMEMFGLAANDNLDIID